MRSAGREAGEAVYQEMQHFAAELQARGVLQAVNSLASAGTRLKVRGGQRHVVDGPFAEAKELVGGYFLVGVTTRDEALAIAAAARPRPGPPSKCAKSALASFSAEVPLPSARPTRLASAVEVIYSVFNEGYAATAGDKGIRLALCEEALRMGRVLAGLMPDEPRVSKAAATDFAAPRRQKPLLTRVDLRN